MAYVDPTTLDFKQRLLNAGDTIARRADITAADGQMLAENNMWAWSCGCLSPLLQHSTTEPRVRDLGSYTTVLSVPARLGLGRYRLRAFVGGDYLTPKIIVKTRAGVTLTTWTGTTVGLAGWQFGDIPVGDLVGDEDVIVELQLINNTQATELRGARVLEICADLAAYAVPVETLDGLEMSISKTTYDGLPTVANGLGTPTDGAHGLVTTTAAAGVYTYIEEVSATHPGTAAVTWYPFDMWVPSDVAARGLTYVVNAAGYPARMSMSVNGESLATCTARGWTDASSGGGSVTDGTGKAVGACSTLNGYYYYNFIPVAFSSGTEMFLVTEMNGTDGGGGGDNNNEGTLNLLDGYKAMRITTLGGNVLNRVQWTSPPTTELGNGYIDQTAFDRCFARVPTGSTGAALSTEPGMCAMWRANGGWAPSQAILAQKKDASATGGLSFHFYGYQYTSGQSIGAEWREFHALQIGTP